MHALNRSPLQTAMSLANDMIHRMPAAFDAEAAGDLRMTVQYMIEEPAFVTIDAGTCRVDNGIADAADVTLTLSGTHLVKLITGRMRGITAFVTGRLKVGGNMILAARLQQVFDRERLL